MTLQSTKSILAKLLATENISVVFANVPTAYFDVEKRVMTLPIWKDVSSELYDLLGGHEVGHALFTPADGWHSNVEGVSANFKTFLNVVEDARIERKIKDKFPGIRRSFYKGYTELFESDFFGIKGRDVNKLLLIDRINIHFKLGSLADITFKSSEELGFVRRMEVADSWEEVVQIAKDLYAFCEQELEDKKQEMLAQKMQMQMGDGEESDDESGEQSMMDEMEDNFRKSSLSFEDEDGEFDSDGSEVNDESGDAEDGEDGEDASGGYGSGWTHEQFGDVPKSITDENFQKKVQTIGADVKDVVNGIMPKMSQMDLSKVIVDWKLLRDQMVKRECGYYKNELLAEFESKNKNAIAYLVKEFELRKKAAENRRVSVSDTGVIDTNLLHTYKFDDNIFRKIATVAEGKNHGLIALLDWSGSMQNCLSDTIEQLLVVAMFCRKISVPFEVYCFSTEWSNLPYTADYFADASTKVTNIMDFRGHMKLLNILSSRMPNHQFRRAVNDLLNVGDAYAAKARNNWSTVYRSLVGDNFHLGGTPLNNALAALSKVAVEFRKANKLEVLNVLVLTDGEDSERVELMNASDRYKYNVGPTYTDSRVCYVNDPDTNISYKVKNSITETLIKIVKDRSQCNMIGFYILPNRKSVFENAMHRTRVSHRVDYNFEKIYTTFRSDGVVPIEGAGYDEYFLISENKLEVENDKLDDLIKTPDDKKISTRALAGAFMKMNKNRLNNRVLLKKFIERTT